MKYFSFLPSIVPALGGLLMVLFSASAVILALALVPLALCPLESWPGVVFGVSAVVLCASAVALLALVIFSEK